MKALLAERRRHERAGCVVSCGRDWRCRACKDYDALTLVQTEQGWRVTDYDRTLLRSLRISPR